MRTLPPRGASAVLLSQWRDTTALLEGPTLAENQYRKKKSDFKEAGL